LCASVAEVLCESAIAKLAVPLWDWSSLQVIVCELRGGGGEGRKGRTDRRKGRAEGGVCKCLGERWEGRRERGGRGKGGTDGTTGKVEDYFHFQPTNYSHTHARRHTHAHTHMHTSTV